MLITKRDKSVVEFNKVKIFDAIMKAMKFGSGIVSPQIALDISCEIEEKYEGKNEELTVEKVESDVYYELIKRKQTETAKAYEGYRAVQEFKRKNNTIDNSVVGLVECTNKEAMNENSNKDAKILPTQRDLIAGEVSKDYARRKQLPAYIVQAHDNGTIHWHDMDYTMQQMHNCALVNIDDMLTNGTVINDKMVETPQSFQVACTVATQIIAQIASGQYGGQSINIRHLGKYLRRTYDKAYNKYVKRYLNKGFNVDVAHEMAKDAATDRMQEDLESGVQTMQYQINTLMTTNGLL